MDKFKSAYVSMINEEQEYDTLSDIKQIIRDLSNVLPDIPPDHAIREFMIKMISGVKISDSDLIDTLSQLKL